MTDRAPHGVKPLGDWDPAFGERGFTEIARRLHAFLRQRIRNTADAEDVVQQACLKVLEANYRADNLQALLFKTAINIANDQQRMSARRDRLNQQFFAAHDGEVDVRTPETIAAARAELAAVARAVNALSEADRNVWHRWQAGESQAEIALTLDVSRRTVERQLASILVRIRRSTGHSTNAGHVS